MRAEDGNGSSIARKHLYYIGTLNGEELCEWATSCQGTEFSLMIMECRENGDSDEDIKTLEKRHKECLSAADCSVGGSIKGILDKSVKDAYDPIEEQAANETFDTRCPKWPTGLRDIDEKTGGGYGLCVYAGEPKVGKSFLALSSAVEAALSGWRVLYLNCELSQAEVSSRLYRYVDGNFTSELVRRLTILNMNVGFSIEDVTDRFVNKVGWGDTKMLIVLDSINRAADFASEHDGSETNYWGLLRKWTTFAMQSRRQSFGKISWLIVSELNRAKEVKGQSLEYIADMVVRLENADIPDMAKIDIAMSRSTPSGLVGDGIFLRDHARSRFIGNPNNGEGNLA